MSYTPTLCNTTYLTVEGTSVMPTTKQFRGPRYTVLHPLPNIVGNVRYSSPSAYIIPPTNRRLGPLSLINYPPSIDQTRAIQNISSSKTLPTSPDPPLRLSLLHYFSLCQSPLLSPPSSPSIAYQNCSPPPPWQPRRHGPLRRFLLRFQSGSSSLRQDGLLQPSNPHAGSSLDLQP